MAREEQKRRRKSGIRRVKGRTTKRSSRQVGRLEREKRQGEGKSKKKRRQIRT